MNSQAGKTPAMVDVDAFAVQNAYEANYELDPTKTVALVNMGASVGPSSIVRPALPFPSWEA